MKKLLFFICFLSLPFTNYSQIWHQYSDSIISNINKNNLIKAVHFGSLVEDELKNLKVIKDTIYADYLYSKGALDYYQKINSANLLNESLSIWDASTKKNYYKIMKIHYFIGENYIDEENHDLAILSFEKCYEINKKYKLKENGNFTNSVYLLAYLYDNKGKKSKASKYAEEFIALKKLKANEKFDFKYAKAFQYKNDISEQEKVLLGFLKNYNQNQLKNPYLFFKINFELFFFYSINNNVSETIKYGEKAYKILQNEKLKVNDGEMKVILSNLIAKYGGIGDSINHDKYEKIQYELFPEDEDGDYFSELNRLMNAGNFENFKIKFDEYESLLKTAANYDDLLAIYSLAQVLFERNILFKKEDIAVKLDLLDKNRSSLSNENKIYLDIFFAEYFSMTNNFIEALKICNSYLNTKDIDQRLLFYKFKTICEMSLSIGDAKKTAYKTLDIANSIYSENDPKLLPYLSLVLTVDVLGLDNNTAKIASKTLQILKDNNLEKTDIAIGIWISIGQTAFNKKNLLDAKNYYLKALDLLESTKNISNSIYYYSVLLQLANVELSEKNNEKSLAYSKKAKLFLDSNPQIIQMAHGDYYYQLGDIYFHQDQFEKAKTNYEKSFVIYGPEITNARKLNYILCDYFINDDVNQTILLLEQFQKDNNGFSGVSKIIYLLKYNSGDVIGARNLLVKQLKILITDNNQYFHLLSDYEKEILYKNFSDQFEFLNTHLLYNDESFLKEYINFRFYSKSLLFSNSFKVVDLNDKDQELYSELKNNTLLINKANETKNVDLKETESLMMRNREIEKFLSLNTKPIAVPTIKDLTSKLKVNEAYVEIIRINKQSKSATKEGIDVVNQYTDSIYYGAIIIKKNSKPKFIIIDDLNLMESTYFIDFQKNVQGTNKLEIDMGSYSLLFEKIDKELNKVDKTYLVTDGVYNAINLESIYNPLKKQYVLDYLKIELVQNVKSIIDDKKELEVNTNLKASLFGNPDFKINTNGNEQPSIAESILEGETNRSLLSELKTKQKIGYLPGTEKEIQSINTILKESNWIVDLYTNEIASEDNLKKVKSPDILHIATHGFFIKNDNGIKKQMNLANLVNETLSSNSYLKSGLLLSGAQNSLNNDYFNSPNNGILSAEEAKSIELKNTELVVLSACETGLGENLVGEGVIGLQRAFMIAGAKSVIMSLWKVDDASTQKLMTLFYTNWIKNKMSKSDAFYAAKTEMKKLFLQPYYWAGFVLVE